MNRAERRAAGHGRKPPVAQTIYDGCATFVTDSDGTRPVVWVGVGHAGHDPAAVTFMCPHEALKLADELRQLAELAVLQLEGDGCCG